MDPVIRRRLALVLVAGSLAVAGGCGADRKSTPLTVSTDGPAAPALSPTAPTTAPRPAGQGPRGRPPPVNTVIRDFAVRVLPSEARLTATVTRPTKLTLLVHRLGAANPVKVATVPFGSRSGRLDLSWDLRAQGRRVAPGRYRLRLRGSQGAGRSRPVEATIGG